jgi:hypothetical protein
MPSTTLDCPISVLQHDYRLESSADSVQRASPILSLHSDRGADPSSVRRVR